MPDVVTNEATVRRIVIDWLDDNYHFGDAEKLIETDDASFLDRGILDSLGYVQLILHLEKAFGLLATFDAGHRAQSLSQLAERAQTDLSTAQRFAFTLERLGLIRKDRKTRLYELAPRMMTFGFRYLQGNDLIERAMPMMLHLSKTTEAAVIVRLYQSLRTGLTKAQP